MIDPPFKWVGGKTKLLPILSKLCRPRAGGRYFEPFCGGAAVFFALGHERARISDANPDLINAYKAIASGAAIVSGHVAALAAGREEMGAKRHYQEVRAVWNAPPPRIPDQFARAAAFIYLNRCGFNGLYRVNKAGKFNVPVGAYKNPLALVPSLLEAAAPRLARAEIWCGSYETTTLDAAPGDLVYFDPPYIPLSPTASFTSYVPGGFNEPDQRDLARWAVALAERGVDVVVSNSDTPLARELYASFEIHSVRVGRAINSKASKRGAVGEIIATNVRGAI